MLCKICNTELDTWRKLARHIKDKHNMTTKDYYDLYLDENNNKICPICGNDNKFINLRLGYHTTCCHSCHTKLQYLSYSINEKDIINSKRKNTWQEKDIDSYKQLQSNIQKDRWNQISNEERKEFGQKVSISLQNRSDEEKELSKQKYSLAAKRRNENMTEDEKLSRNSSVSNGLKNYYNNMTEEEHKVMIESMHERFNFSSEERKTIGIKISKSLQKKTKEEWSIIKQKEIETRRKNNTLNTSKPEDRCYDLLLTKYNSVIRSYKSERYPYFCDFYIKELDLYIECNFHWTHGGHPFNKMSNNDINTLNIWKQKHSKYYNIAIYVWSILDVKKFKIANDNKLNYLVFYTEKDFQDWFYSL